MIFCRNWLGLVVLFSAGMRAEEIFQVDSWNDPAFLSLNRTSRPLARGTRILGAVVLGAGGRAWLKSSAGARISVLGPAQLRLLPNGEKTPLLIFDYGDFFVQGGSGGDAEMVVGNNRVALSGREFFLEVGTRGKSVKLRNIGNALSYNARLVPSNQSIFLSEADAEVLLNSEEELDGLKRRHLSPIENGRNEEIKRLGNLSLSSGFEAGGGMVLDDFRAAGSWVFARITENYYFGNVPLKNRDYYLQAPALRFGLAGRYSASKVLSDPVGQKERYKVLNGGVLLGVQWLGLRLQGTVTYGSDFKGQLRARSRINYLAEAGYRIDLSPISDSEMGLTLEIFSSPVKLIHQVTQQKFDHWLYGAQAGLSFLF